MIAFDTNYVVRHLVQDDAQQCAVVLSTMQKESDQGRNIVLYDIVLCETLWVLSAVYQATRRDLIIALKALKNESIFLFENPERVESALLRFEMGSADFADYLILEIGKEKNLELKTFDKKLRKEF